jgi:hypothetical protein
MFSMTDRAAFFAITLGLTRKSRARDFTEKAPADTR